MLAYITNLDLDQFTFTNLFKEGTRTNIRRMYLFKIRILNHKNKTKMHLRSKSYFFFGWPTANQHLKIIHPSILNTQIHLLKESYFNKSKVQISTKTVDQFFNVFRKYSTI